MSSPTWGEAAAIAPAGTATGTGTGTEAGTEADAEAGAAAAFGALGQFVGQPPLAGQFVIIYLMSDTQRRHCQWRQCVINVGVLSNLLNTGRETRASSTTSTARDPAPPPPHRRCRLQTSRRFMMTVGVFVFITPHWP